MDALPSAVCPVTERVPVATRFVVVIFDVDALAKYPFDAVTDVNDGEVEKLIVFPDHERLEPSEIRVDGVL